MMDCLDDDILATPPSEWERRGYGERLSDIDAVIKNDKARFRLFSKKHGFVVPRNLYLYEKDKRFKPE